MQRDVIIVGAALAGASLAAALRGSRFRIAVVENRTPSFPAADAWDSRIYAISPANVRFLEAIGVWSSLRPERLTPIYDMEVHGDGGARLDFSAYDIGVGELAWTIEGSLMQRALWEALERQSNVELLCPAQPSRLAIAADKLRLAVQDGRDLEARLIVAADGVNSWVRREAGIRDTTSGYGEMGLVANFECERPHKNKAYQWFRADGVLAYLPLPGRRISIVWSTRDEHARELLRLDPGALCARVAAAAQQRLGSLDLITPAQAFPLRLMRVERTVAQRVALIGDAAHAIHPLSGHGINLGFQDARVLAHTLTGLPRDGDCGEQVYLRRYARARAEEVFALQTVTHGLQRLFRPQQALISNLRNLGLNLTNRLPVLRTVLARYALG